MVTFHDTPVLECVIHVVTNVDLHGYWPNLRVSISSNYLGHETTRLTSEHFTSLQNSVFEKLRKNPSA